MSKMTKRLIIFLLMMGFSTGLFYVYSGYQHPKKKVIKKLTKEEYEKFDKEMNEMVFGRTAVLLSAKYDIDEKSVFDLLVEDAAFNVRREKEIDRELFKKSKIIEYSKKFSIPVEKIACILLDYGAIAQLERTADALSDISNAQHS